MIIEKVVAGPLETNAYLVGCEESHEGIVIDPGLSSSKRLLLLIEKHKLLVHRIYLTHSHFDHTADVAGLKESRGWQVFVHPEDAENLRTPGSDGLPNILMLKQVEPDGFLLEGQEHWIGKLRFIVMHTPGHSPGGVVFYFPEEKVLFSGDTLFRGTYGRVDLPTSDGEKMKASLEKIKKLPDDVIVYPGHGSATTIGVEKRWL